MNLSRQRNVEHEIVLVDLAENGSFTDAIYIALLDDFFQGANRCGIKLVLPKVYRRLRKSSRAPDVFFGVKAKLCEHGEAAEEHDERQPARAHLLEEEHRPDVAAQREDGVREVRLQRQEEDVLRLGRPQVEAAIQPGEAVRRLARGGWEERLAVGVHGGAF